MALKCIKGPYNVPKGLTKLNFHDIVTDMSQLCQPVIDNQLRAILVCHKEAQAICFG